MLVIQAIASFLNITGNENGTVYVEIVMGILFCEIVNKLAPPIFRIGNMPHSQTSYGEFSWFLCSQMQTNSWNTLNLIHCENVSVYERENDFNDRWCQISLLITDGSW